MNAQELKNSILQRAIEGKLVPQMSDEGDANELLAEIRAEKERLIKEKKIKRTKSLPPIEEDEKPFAIPESWAWVRLGDISSYAQTKKKISAKDIQDDMWSLDMEDIEKDTGRIIHREKAGNRKISGDKVVFKSGNILYSKLRPYLKKILVAPNDGICTSELVPFTCYGKISNEYVTWYLHSPYVNQEVNSVSYGVKMPRVSKETMIMLLVPLPPFAEQKRIVAKIEELLPYIEQYNKAHTKLSTLNAKFPKQMKKSLLQYAMEGKLVPQHAEDGTADELLAEIRAEKERLVKEKKIKKTKPLPEISDDEKPFEIPQNWAWVRLSDVIDVRDGTHDTPAYQATGIPLVTSKNLSLGHIDFSTAKNISQKDADKINERSKVEIGDILFAMIGSIGNPVFVTESRKFCIKNIALFKNYPSKPVEMKYIYWLLISLQENFRQNASGAVQSFVSLKKFRESVVPLPPLAEQKRIVARLEELLPYCDKLIACGKIK